MTGGAGRADAVARLAGELHTFEEWAHKEAKKLVRASYGEVRLLFTEPAAGLHGRPIRSRMFSISHATL